MPASRARRGVLHYPLSIGKTLRNLGLVESVRILASYAKAHLTPKGPELSFEDWVTARFGRRLFEMFFKTYTEKVWGIPCTEIRADWAAQRIRNLSLFSAVKNALMGSRDVKSLINEFDYPRFGPGQMWERFRQRVEEGGGEVRLGARVVEI
ncbi:MAG: FAD-dependent oxidoreductase, partial [Singulisphaera sp.]